MSAGQQPTIVLVNSQLTSAAVRLQSLLSQVTDLHLQFSVKLGAAGLQALAQAEGVTLSAADAADIIARWDTLGTIADIYFGRAGQASPYPFNDALADVRGGQAD